MSAAANLSVALAPNVHALAAREAEALGLTVDEFVGGLIVDAVAEDAFDRGPDRHAGGER